MRTAVNAAMSAIKGRRIGTNLLDITTCGAVAPYNRMLGGKLVALLLLSPRVGGRQPAALRSRAHHHPFAAQERARRPRQHPGLARYHQSLRARQQPVRAASSSRRDHRSRPARDPLHVPGRHHRLRHRPVRGRHGSRSRRRASNRRRGFRDVNGIFGEGASPRLRKLRSGLNAIGFRADLTMLHHQERRTLRRAALRRGQRLPVRSSDPIFPTTSPGPRPTRRRHRAHRRVLAAAVALQPAPARRQLDGTLGETRPWLLSSTIPLPEPPSFDSRRRGPGGQRRRAGGREPAGVLAQARSRGFQRRLGRADGRGVRGPASGDAAREPPACPRPKPVTRSC